MDEELKAVMKRLEASSALQASYAKKQYRLSMLTAASSIVILGIVVFSLITVIPQINAVFQQLNSILQDLELVVSQLAETDLSEMITKINSLDIDALNQAIQNLSDAVNPLAQFFNNFG